MPTAIEFNHVSKQYRLGLVSTKTLSHDLDRWWKMNILGKEDPYLKIGETNDRATKGTSDYVWALKDIDFKVEQGDVIGIIGKNGAGKSTLLKLLSKVTGPTTGSIKARGRIGALLEVGTGFHPEMTGRENIFLNGAILGMSRQEIAKKLDEIVDFSGCERYLDTPVKRYSSGMMVRLGFAVAAHLDPEILVVDEVLAVGDAEFQKKAIGKMKDVSKGEGRTVLFVSHNMASVKSLCKHGILLENGRVKNIGTIEPIVNQYMLGDSEIINHKIWEKPEYKGGGFELLELGIKKENGEYSDMMRVDQQLEIHVAFRLLKPFINFHISLYLRNEMGNYVFMTCSKNAVPVKHDKGEYNLTCHIPANFINWGTYMIDVFAVENGNSAFVMATNVISFILSNRELEIGEWMGREPGDVTPQFEYNEIRI